jgi:hypothetical protein
VGIEPFVEGIFQKHNSNISSGTERSTPNAFSHFTWEASKHTLLVCDIQGVGDLYTDPQIMTASGVGYGRGNLGPNGIKAFFMRHKCNQICELLGLSEKGTSGFQRLGTPSSPLLEGMAPSAPLSTLRAGSRSPPRKLNPNTDFDSDVLMPEEIRSDSCSRGSIAVSSSCAVSTVDDDILGLFASSPPVTTAKAVSSSTTACGVAGSKNITAIPPPRKSAVVHSTTSPSISEADENLMDSILNGL